MNSESATIAVFDGDILFSASLDAPFCDVIKQCAELLNDSKLTQENFSAVGYFFFRTERSLIDDRGFFLNVFTLRTMGIKDGQLLELCYVP